MIHLLKKNTCSYFYSAGSVLTATTGATKPEKPKFLSKTIVYQKKSITFAPIFEI